MKPAHALALSALALGSLTLASTVEAAGRSVDIYLSAGKKTGDVSCDAQNDGTCEIWHLKMNLGDAAAGTIEKLVSRVERGDEKFSIIESALSPNGTRLAWIERSSKSNQLWAMDLAKKERKLVADGGAKTGSNGAKVKPEWPEWLTDSVLLFSGKTGDKDGVAMKTVYSVSVSDLANPGEAAPRLGAAGVDGTKDGTQDPAVRKGKVVSFGPENAGANYVPRVQEIGTDGTPKGSYTDFTLGKTAGGAAIKECHHPAWNYAGTAIMCMVQNPQETFDGTKARLLYTYSDTGSGWANQGRTFEPVEMTKSTLDSAKLLTAAAGCQTINYKYAQWCGSDDYVLATVYCSGAATGDRGAPVTASRVMLIGTNPVQYVDLTSLIEKNQKGDVGTFSAFTGTCSTAK